MKTYRQPRQPIEIKNMRPLPCEVTIPFTIFVTWISKGEFIAEHDESSTGAGGSSRKEAIENLLELMYEKHYRYSRLFLQNKLGRGPIKDWQELVRIFKVTEQVQEGPDLSKTPDETFVLDSHRNRLTYIKVWDKDFKTHAYLIQVPAEGAEEDTVDVIVFDRKMVADNVWAILKEAYNAGFEEGSDIEREKAEKHLTALWTA